MTAPALAGQLLGEAGWGSRVVGTEGPAIEVHVRNAGDPAPARFLSSPCCPGGRGQFLHLHTESLERMEQCTAPSPSCIPFHFKPDLTGQQHLYVLLLASLKP